MAHLSTETLEPSTSEIARPKVVAACLTALGIALVGVVDYLSGVELRVYPLYYAPVSIAAWRLGRLPSAVTAILCTVSWAASNYAAGLRYSSPAVWTFNLVMQAFSFAAIGLLIASLRLSLAHERELSRTDDLTSLLNARAFHEEAGRILDLSRRKRHPVAVGYIDLDEFKSLNDALGHEAGNQVLRDVATVLRKAMRASDLTARVGGDEFAVFLPETNPDEARAVLERLAGRLTETLSRAPRLVTASIGGVAFLRVPASVEAMVHAADARMYAAKAAGRNRVDVQVVDDGPPEA